MAPIEKPTKQELIPKLTQHIKFKEKIISFLIQNKNQKVHINLIFYGLEKKKEY